ncbi:MAG: hypothetical protein AAGK32_19095, partial [Actinomycetota bacterium]
MSRPAEESAERRAEDEPAGWVRPAVYGFLAVFILCGLLSIEVWPLTGWRLYHERRTSDRSSWQLVAVDPAGEEATIHLGELPLGWRNTTKLLGEFDDLGPDGRDEVCDAWAAPRRDSGEPVAEVRVYRVRSDLDDPGVRSREL